MTEAEWRGPSPAANWTQVDARELAVLRKLRDKAASFISAAINAQPCLPLDLAWILGELEDAVAAVDEFDVTP